MQVHDFTTNSSWQITAPGTLIREIGIANNGMITYIALTDDDISHVYIQPKGATPNQIDNCTAADAANSFCAGFASMSDDGNLIAFTGDCFFTPTANPCGDRIFLYNVSTGTMKNMFPANTRHGDLLDEPVLSGDGTHIAVEYRPKGSDADATIYVVIKSIDGSPVSTAGAVATFDPQVPSDIILSQLNQDGSILTYVKETAGDIAPIRWELYKNGRTYNVPRLATTILNLDPRLTSDGSKLIYTLELSNFHDSYPGVYEWQTP
jgi:hypothetical protein